LTGAIVEVAVLRFEDRVDGGLGGLRPIGIAQVDRALERASRKIDREELWPSQERHVSQGKGQAIVVRGVDRDRVAYVARRQHLDLVRIKLVSGADVVVG